MKNKKVLIIGSGAPENITKIASAQTSNKEALLVTVVKSNATGFTVSGVIRLGKYAPDAIISSTAIEEGQGSNAYFTLNLDKMMLDENSITVLSEYEAKVDDLYEHLAAVENGEKEDTRFNGEISFFDLFTLNDDGSLRNVTSKPGLGLAYPNLEVTGWMAAIIEMNSEAVNQYHKVTKVLMGEGTSIAAVLNSGGLKPVVATEETMDEFVKDFMSDESSIMPRPSTSTGTSPEAKAEEETKPRIINRTIRK